MLSESLPILHIKAQVKWEIALHTETGRWIGKCDPLELTAEATSCNELHEVIAETMALLFDDLLSTGHFHSFLTAKGWQLMQPLPFAGLSGISGKQVDLPWSSEKVLSLGAPTTVC